MKRSLLLVQLLLLSALTGFSQHADYWSSGETSRSTITKDKSVARAGFPTNYKLFNLNLEPLRQTLMTAVVNRSASPTVIALPNTAGEIETFEVYEASNFDPVLQARFPAIRSFSGKGITDNAATLKLSLSPQGIQTMIFRVAKENEFIEPYSQDHTVYAVFNSQRGTGGRPWNCGTPDDGLALGLDQQLAANSITARSTGDLKTMRLAQSVTAEYSNYFGATSAAQVSLVLAAVNATLTRCNGVYEKDLALHLNLISSTTSVFYYNAATDPYSNASTGAGGAWNGELQRTLTSVIGEANYDIGHLFGASGGGGNAGCIGCICVNGSKGSGFTSPADGVPQGDNFDIDYVVHEIGHQLGGNHTFSMNNEGSGVNKEIGSGITIMGYAGITSQDVAPHSIDIYHQATLAQIQTNLGSKTCPVTTSISANNATPVVAAVPNYTIPKSTPFALTGSATDANASNVLTYCWEQNDNASSAQTGTNSVASPTKASGPNWISFRPTTSPTRLFPQLATILTGGQVTGPLPGGDAGANIEALSSVARTLNFRLTVRDNAPYSSTAPVSVGQTAFTDMTVTVSAASGPFIVTVPNTALSWAGNTTQTVTWDVASTTAAPVSCANVKISLSTDGGQTFPTVLVASTANDGSAPVTIPNTPTTTARIKVEAVGNIFFDISNSNFTITAGTSCNAPTGLTTSAITGNSATLSWSAVSGAASYAVDYKAASSGTWITVYSALTTPSTSLSGLNASTTYDWRVRTNCSGSSSGYATAQFTTAAVPACVSAFEPNETQATAAELTSGISSSAAIGSATDIDYFKITTSTTSDMIFSLAGPSGVDYNLYVYNSAGMQLGVGNTTTSNETVSLNSLTQGTYYLKVIGYNGANSVNCYTIRATARPSASCQSSYDAAGNETTGGAAAIPFNTNVTGLINPSGDIDHYKFTVTNSGTITLTLAGMPGDYDLKLLNSSGTQVAISQAGGTTGETINYTAAAGTYYAQVYGYNGANNATTCYTLRIQTGTASRSDESETGKSVIAAIDKDKAGTITIYPNPVHTDLKITTSSAIEPFVATLSDVSGRKILVQPFTGTATLSAAKLTTGIYLITITDKNGTIVKQEKVIKE